MHNSSYLACSFLWNIWLNYFDFSLKPQTSLQQCLQSLHVYTCKFCYFRKNSISLNTSAQTKDALGTDVFVQYQADITDFENFFMIREVIFPNPMSGRSN